MCGWFDDGNSAGDDTRARSRGGSGVENPDRWVTAISVDRAIMGGRLGSHMEMG
jgi:hypothetical protein